MARPAATLTTTSSLLLLATTGCGGEGAAAAGGVWEAVTDTVGDTVAVRTVSGSLEGEGRLVAEVEIGVLEGPPELMFGQITAIDVGPDGSVYVVDRQVPEVRVFGPDGAHRATLGRPGEGPGELNGPDGGLAVLSDGRVLVRDPQNNRIQVYGPDGEPLETWPLRTGFTTSNPLWRDRDDNVHTQVLMDAEADIADWKMGLARITPDGETVDTLPVPDADYEPPFLEARVESEGGRGVSRTGVPFSPSESWAFHPDGYFVHGVSTAYALTLLRPEGPLRIERVHGPVPVTAGERDEERARVTRDMRGTRPDWRWNGPEIPHTKPPYRSVDVGRDGRIWVLVSRPALEVDDPDYDPTDPESVPDRWREPLAFDVFEADGRYLGRLDAPMEMSRYPRPVLDGGSVWAVTRDELDVQRVVRYRVAWGGEEGAS